MNFTIKLSFDLNIPAELSFWNSFFTSTTSTSYVRSMRNNLHRWRNFAQYEEAPRTEKRMETSNLKVGLGRKEEGRKERIERKKTGKKNKKKHKETERIKTFPYCYRRT